MYMKEIRILRNMKLGCFVGERTHVHSKYLLRCLKSQRTENRDMNKEDNRWVFKKYGVLKGEPFSPLVLCFQHTKNYQSVDLSFNVSLPN